ncbi:MAG TPA: hypothetical protein VGC21_02885 [Telluria sp.]|jgi:hypothetical protein
MPLTFLRTATDLATSPPARFFAGRAALAATLTFALRLQALLMLLLGMAICSAPAQAQTMVAGPMLADSHWTLDGAPYVVTGDITVQSGARLRIDAGVTVYMQAGTSLTVEAGALQAIGSAAQPIRVLSDKTRLSAQAVPGDWRNWSFHAGTQPSTKLEHMVFEHGRGLIVKGAAPVLNYLNLRNQLGAAITLDLAASPSGVGLQASGNSVNGIEVPAGDMTGNVNWALRGIPYVLASGALSVGISPVINSVAPEQVQQGQTVNVALNGSRLGGLSAVRFDRAGLSAQILAGASATQATLSVTATAAGAAGLATLSLLTDAGWVHKVNALNVVQAQPILASLNPATIFSNQGTVAVAVNGQNFIAQSVVLVNGTPVATEFVSGTKLSAAIVTPSVNGTLQVRVRTPDPLQAGQFLLSNELTLPVQTAQLGLTPNTLSFTVGANRSLTATLPYPAPVGGTLVTVVSSVPSVASVSSTVLVPEGQSTAVLSVSALAPGQTTVTVSKTGLISAQAQVTVAPAPSLTLAPSALNLGIGRSAELTVTSSVAAGAQGLQVNLASSATQTATVPASVSIVAGSKSATFTVSTLALGSATLSAQATEYTSASATVNVRAVSLTLPGAALVAPGLSRSIPLTLSDPAPAGGLVINLSSSNPANVTVPATVTVPEGGLNVNFTIAGVAAGATSITATASGYQQAQMPVSVEAVQIRFGNPLIDTLSLPEEAVTIMPLSLSRPAPIGGLQVNLAMADGSKASVSPSSITIAEGETSGGVVLVTVTGVQKGVTTLNASAPGLAGKALPVTVSGKPMLQFNRTSTAVGKGMRTYLYEMAVTRYTDGAAYYGNEPVTVNLSSSDATKLGVQSTVVIPAGQATAYFQISGLDLGPATVDAAASGYTSPPTKVSSTVVTPVMSFTSLDTSRAATSARDDFYINFSVPGAAYTSNQIAVADLPIDLSIVEAAPAGIVPGFTNAGGTGVTQVILRANQSETYSGGNGYTYVSTPTAPGTYKVRANASGIATLTSDPVTVSAPQLQFSRASVVVGKGFRTYLYEVRVQRVVQGQLSNGAEPLVISLSSSDPSKLTVPATVTIPANASSVEIQVTGVDLTNGNAVVIDATAAGHTAPAVKLSGTVITPKFTFTSLDTERSSSSARDDFYLQVEVPGASYATNQVAVADMLADLSIVDAAPADIVGGFFTTANVQTTQILFRANQSESYSGGNQYHYVGTPTAAGTYKVQASIPNIATAVSPPVTVTAPALRFTRTPVYVGKGMNTYLYEIALQRTINGTPFNGAAALPVTLSVSDGSKVAVPVTVTIPANASTVNFAVSGLNLTGSTPVTIDASAAGYSAPAVKSSVNVVPVELSFTSLDTIRSPASQRDDFYVNTYVPGAGYASNQTATTDMAIDLAIVNANPDGIVGGFSDAGGAGVTQVVLRQGQSESYSGGNGYTYVSPPNVAGSYQVRASAGNANPGTSSVVTVSPPQLRFNRDQVVVGKGLRTYLHEVSINRVVNGSPFSGAAAVTVNLSCASSAVCTVPASVQIPAGQPGVTFYVTGVGVGSTTVVASAEGYSSLIDLPLTVILPNLTLSQPGNIKVGAQSDFYAALSVPGANYSGNQTAVAPIVVNLTSSSPGVATAPATATIAANATDTGYVKLTAVAAGTTTVTASGSNLNSVTSGVITITP